MAYNDGPLADPRREVTTHAAQPVASPRESRSGVPATVGGISITSAMLMPADHLDAESAWNQHVPFAFWLVQAHAPSIFVELGTYRGTSYFSFCQAVAALRLPTRCFAIDIWRGDSHSGFYDESVFTCVRACNERKYAGFSRLVRSSFDEALPHFLDGSIDLLHIDGLHTYEACKHDFQSWLPKLSRRAIVLFHDTNVRERGFGVHRLWAELIEHYPHFEFVHEHGLGVLGVGEALDAPVRELFAAADDAVLTREIRSAFWRLGSVVQTEIDLKASADERASLQTLLSTSISQSEIEISRLAAEQAQLHLSLEEKERQSADLIVQCAVLRREKAELGMALATARNEKAQLDTAFAVARSENADLGTTLAAVRSENADLGTALAGVRNENADLATALAAARSENADLATALAAVRSESADLATALAAVRNENAELGTTLATALSQNAELDAALVAAREEGVDRCAALAAQAAELSAVRIRAERAEAVSAAARKELDAICRSASWRIARPLRRFDAAHSRLARRASRIVKQVRWARRLGARLHEYFALRSSIKLITASGLFDRDWYLDRNADVRAAGANPLVHYLRHGAAEGRDPNPLFDTDWYLDCNPDVRAAGVNALVHYLRYGATEGRDPNPLFDTVGYLERNPDVRVAGVNPLAHYLQQGTVEGRHSSASAHGNNLPAMSQPPDAASPLNVRRLFAFISGCPGDSYRYRCEHMTELLCNIGYTADAFPANVFPYDQLAAKYSIVVAHRVPWTSQFDDFVKQIRSSGAIVVYDVDDLIFDIRQIDQIDAYNRMNETEQALYRDGVERYGRAMAICDAATVSTERLRDEVQRLHPGMAVSIIRNTVNRTMLKLAADARAAASRREFTTIAYFSGTPTHQGDFSVCEKALYRILKEFATVHLMIVGHLELPDCFAEFGPRVEKVPLVPWQQLFSLYAKVDINLAPLEYDNSFTASKSDLKYFEAALLSVPTIASDLGAYAGSIDNWKNGVLCRDPEQWYHAMRELSQDRELRCRIGEEARKYVERCGTTLAYKRVAHTEWRSLVASSSQARVRSQFASYKPSIAFVVRAPIATTSGGYKKIFVLANYLRSRDYNVRVHVEQIAHLADKSEAEIRDYCALHFGIDPACVFVGHLGIDPVDIAIATNWPTAPVVHDLGQVRAKLYFVQDYEPDFYAKDQPEHGMADATYDLGLSVISIGDYLKELLDGRGRFARSIPFGIEKDFHQAGQKRDLLHPVSYHSVLFFARPGVPRRNFSVGVKALAEIHRKYPNTRIRLYGLESPAELPFPYEHLGQLSQAKLAAEMAQSDIHLSYSLTNISTVIYEAMACGCACVEADLPSVRGMVRNRENCLLADPTESGTVEALDHLINNQPVRQEIARAGYNFAKELTEERMCEEFVAHVLESALVN